MMAPSVYEQTALYKGVLWQSLTVSTALTEDPLHLVLLATDNVWPKIQIM